MSKSIEDKYEWFKNNNSRFRNTVKILSDLDAIYGEVDYNMRAAFFAGYREAQDDLLRAAQGIELIETQDRGCENESD